MSRDGYTIFGMGCFGFLFLLAAILAVLYAAIHFIGKYW
jgi:hypothetical protein